ncbi:MAG: MATE family efflux transporter [Oscillospiraceae bacterium]|nr:MATE family efflux transporter [Oscillospiraceae bacterium]
MNEHEQKFRQMTEPPVQRLICRLAFPCIISMLVTSFYNMADTFFVGMMDSNSATAAVGVVFSMMAIIQAVGFFFGHGSGNYISRELGKKNYEEASNMAATGFYYSLAAGVLICVAGLIFLDPLAYLLGSTDTILPYTKDYLGVILLGAPWMAGSLVLNNQLRYQGSAMYAMWGIVTGAVLNIALDPLLIFTCDLGVAGAGWATIISQFVSFCLLYVGVSRGSNIHISITKVKLKFFYLKEIVRGGLPSLARQCLASFATISLNLAAGMLHDDAIIAAMGIVQRIMMFGASTMIGFGQGFQPVCGFNYGAKLYNRVRDGFWFCVKTSLGFLIAVSALMFIFAPELIGLFRNDPAVIQCGASALRFQCVAFPAQSWIVMSNMMEQSIGRTAPATFLATARQGVFFIPTVWILFACFGLLGIQMAQAVSDLLTLACAIPIHIHVLRTLEPQKTSQLQG